MFNPLTNLTHLEYKQIKSLISTNNSNSTIISLSYTTVLFFKHFLSHLLLLLLGFNNIPKNQLTLFLIDSIIHLFYLQYLLIPNTTYFYIDYNLTHKGMHSLNGNMAQVQVKVKRKRKNKGKRTQVVIKPSVLDRTRNRGKQRGYNKNKNFRQRLQSINQLRLNTIPRESVRYLNVVKNPIHCVVPAKIPDPSSKITYCFSSYTMQTGDLEVVQPWDDTAEEPNAVALLLYLTYGPSEYPTAERLAWTLLTIPIAATGIPICENITSFDVPGIKPTNYEAILNLINSIRLVGAGIRIKSATEVSTSSTDQFCRRFIAGQLRLGDFEAWTTPDAFIPIGDIILNTLNWQEYGNSQGASSRYDPFQDKYAQMKFYEESSLTSSDDFAAFNTHDINFPFVYVEFNNPIVPVLGNATSVATKYKLSRAFNNNQQPTPARQMARIERKIRENIKHKAENKLKCEIQKQTQLMSDLVIHTDDHKIDTDIQQMMNKYNDDSKDDELSSYDTANDLIPTYKLANKQLNQSSVSLFVNDNLNNNNNNNNNNISNNNNNAKNISNFNKNIQNLSVNNKVSNISKINSDNIINNNSNNNSNNNNNNNIDDINNYNTINSINDFSDTNQLDHDKPRRVIRPSNIKIPLAETTISYTFPIIVEAKWWLEATLVQPTVLIAMPSPVDPNWDTLYTWLCSTVNFPRVSDGHSFKPFIAKTGKFLKRNFGSPKRINKSFNYIGAMGRSFKNGLSDLSGMVGQ